MDEKGTIRSDTISADPICPRPMARHEVRGAVDRVDHPEPPRASLLYMLMVIVILIRNIYIYIYIYRIFICSILVPRELREPFIE